MAEIILPYDINAESGVVGTLIYHPEFIFHSEYLKPSYFYRKENACIYWAIQELYKEGIDNIDTFNIITKIESNKKTKQMFAGMNITSLQDLLNMYQYVVRNTLEEYKLVVDRVVALAFKRAMYNKLEQIQRQCLDANDVDINALYGKANSEINALAETFIATERVELFTNKIDEIWSNIKKRQTDEGTYGYQSKFPLLNDYCPYEKGELHVFAAPRKTGKSMVMMNELANFIKNDIPVAYLDTEMGEKRFMERFLAHLTQVSINKIKRGTYTPSEEILINDTLKYLKSKKFTYIYDPNWTNEKIYATTKILIHKMGLEVLIYDYMKGSSLSASEQYNELGNKTNFLKNEIAGALDIAVIAGSQLNRNNEIGDSYKIEQYASTVINFKPKTPDEISIDGEECGNYKMWVKLNRNGEQQEVESGEYIDLLFKGNTATIEQTAKQHETNNPFN